jgi:DNA polymerase-3 subunit chi
MVRGDHAAALLHACRICAKAFDHGFRTAALVNSNTEAEQLDELLWRFDGQRFIGHERWPDGDWVSGAVVLISAEQAPPPPGRNGLLLDLTGSGELATGYQRLADVFSHSEQSRDSARERYRRLQRQGFELHFHDIEPRPGAAT